jgi:D-alanine-D-alanine ligase
MLSKNGIPTPQYQIFNDPSERNDLKFPLLVKPLHEDASIGINLDSYVTNEEELKKKVAEIISSYKQPALVEEYIDGQEINAAMIGNGKAQVLPLSEIVFSYPKGVPNILTFDAKWIEDSDLYKNSVGRCPADVDVKTAKKIEEISKKCYKLMGCKGYARIDFRVKDGIPYVIEVNPNPCINPNGTGFVRSSVAAGMDYGEMVEKILKLAK